MSSDNSDNPVDKIAQRLAQGSGHRQNILAVFDTANTKELNSSTLRERADVPLGSMNHHLTKLEEWNLIEETGKREPSSGGGRRARIWRLTEFGEELIATTDDALSPPQSAKTAERVTALENQVNQLRNRVEELEQETQERNETIVEILKVVAAAQDDETRQQVEEIASSADL